MKRAGFLECDAVKNSFLQASSCGAKRDDCCYDYIELDLIEVNYLSNKISNTSSSTITLAIYCCTLSLKDFMRSEKSLAHVEQ